MTCYWIQPRDWRRNSWWFLVALPQAMFQENRKRIIKKRIKKGIKLGKNAAVGLAEKATEYNKK